MLEGLLAGFSEETQADIGLPEYVVLHLIYRMFKEDPQNFSHIIWPDNKSTSALKYIEFKDIINPVLDGGSKTVESIQAYFSQNKRKLRESLRTEINGVLYEIRRADTKTIFDLFRVLDEDDPEDYLELIRNADKSIFPTNDDLIRYFNDLMRFYACFTNKQPLLLLGIDEVTKSDEEIGSNYYRTLGNLFVRLRNSLNYVLFVFISTTEDWVKYDNIINVSSDLFSQIQDFMYRIVLKQLNVSEMTMVFKNRIQRFWDKYPSEKPALNPYYPFSMDCFEYVYRYHMRDLRKSIQFLDELWKYFRYNREVPLLEDMYSTMRIVRAITGKNFDPDDLKKFEWDIIDKSFNDPARFRTNSARSSVIEKGIENAWKCLQQEPGSPITKVENNPIIKTSTGKRKPDIYVELHGNLGAEYRRVVEFQVKAYQEGNRVNLSQIESSLELFDEGYTDFIYFIITGKGLDTRSEYRVKTLENKFPTRIRRPPLNSIQERFLYFLALYEEITGSLLGKNLEKDIPITKKILTNIIGQMVDKFLIDVKNLSYRRPEIIEESVETIEVPEISFKSTSQKPDRTFNHIKEELDSVLDSLYSILDKDSSKGQLATSSTPQKMVQWLKKYPRMIDYKYEACALCLYMQTREKGRYKHKFTVATVVNNVIRKDASTSPQKFKGFVKFLLASQLIQKERSSYKWTQSGIEFYYSVKEDNFQY
ncbi:MAG: hypothetical protein ACXAEU_26505, partial [Candidatus Hodarchaeales archaeon]|jgi:hypothetical protein